MIIDDGISETVISVDPHINHYEVTDIAADSKVYTITVEALTAAGSVISGTNQMKMANVPG